MSANLRAYGLWPLVVSKSAVFVVLGLRLIGGAPAPLVDLPLLPVAPASAGIEALGVVGRLAGGQISPSQTSATTYRSIRRWAGGGGDRTVKRGAEADSFAL